MFLHLSRLTKRLCYSKKNGAFVLLYGYDICLINVPTAATIYRSLKHCKKTIVTTTIGSCQRIVFKTWLYFAKYLIFTLKLELFFPHQVLCAAFIFS